MSIESLSSEENAKLRYVIEEGIKTTQQIADLRGSLRDTIKAVSDDLNLEAKDIRFAIRAAIKDSLAADKEKVENAEFMLALVGRR